MEVDRRNDSINRVILAFTRINTSWQDLVRFNPHYDEGIPVELVRHQIYV